MEDRARDTETSTPTIHFRTPTFRSDSPSNVDSRYESRRSLNDVDLKPSHPHLVNEARDSSEPASSSHDIYLGSYSRRPRSAGGPLPGARTPIGSVAPSTRGSQSQIHLQGLLQELQVDEETYGVEELRDGFFDTLFVDTKPVNLSQWDYTTKAALPSAMRGHHPLSVRYALQTQAYDTIDFMRKITTTRAGIKLAKTFLAYFIAYVICLIPAARHWLGRYNFILVLSTILNHPGRPIGAQLDGAVLTILGTIAGLGWGSLALYVSTSTATARAGYGGVLATFMIMFTALISYLRCTFIRSYQLVICAGIAIVYTCLADTSDSVGWKKIFDYGIPWVLGQGLCLVICLTVFPDAGSRAVAATLHKTMVVLQRALQLPRVDEPEIRRELGSIFVDLSGAVRDLTIDIAVTRFNPDDVRTLRNLIQGIIRSILAAETSTTLFDQPETRNQENVSGVDKATEGQSTDGTAYTSQQTLHHDVIGTISKSLAQPLKAMIGSMESIIVSSDAALLDISGYREYFDPLGPPDKELLESLNSLEDALVAFDAADTALINHQKLPLDYAMHPEVVELLTFVHPVRQIVGKVEAFARKVLEMQKTNSVIRIHRPSYPFGKSLDRTNAQVRHDRGGLTAGFYFRSKRELERTMRDLQSRAYVALPDHHLTGQRAGENDANSAEGMYQDEKLYFEERSTEMPEKTKFRYKLWEMLHTLQGFESRFAFKVVLVTTLLSVPAWLSRSSVWWNVNESWWAVVMVWLMMHPRVGGNFQDLTTRVVTAAIGAIWGGFAYAAANGNPYVMAVFAATIMTPMLYRFTQSSHPRSGIAGCVSFTIVSLSAYTDQGLDGVVHIAWTRGTAIIVGVTAAVLVNWIIWPFVARHELRKSVSTMLLHMAIFYRGIVAKYVYYTWGEEPSTQDNEKSEMIEGRLREAFVRMRQLLELTRHEIRLRAPFEPRPYSALIDTCERFYEDLIRVRQSSLYFQPMMLQTSETANEALLSYRRDAVAAVLMNLYILAGALKSDRPIPRYMPSAGAARKRLLMRMTELREDGNEQPEHAQKRNWADVYQYAFSKALTDIVEQLDKLQSITKAITGEVGFDLPGLRAEPLTRSH